MSILRQFSFGVCKYRRHALWAVLILSLFALQASAGICTWTGAGSNKIFTNAANWTPAAPTSSDTAVFNSTAAPCSLNTSPTLMAITFTAGYTGTFNFSGRSLAITSGADFRSGGRIEGAGKLDFNIPAGAVVTFMPIASDTFPTIEKRGGGALVVGNGSVYADAFSFNGGSIDWGDYGLTHHFRTITSANNGHMDFGNSTVRITQVCNLRGLSSTEGTGKINLDGSPSTARYSISLSDSANAKVNILKTGVDTSTCGSGRIGKLVVGNGTWHFNGASIHMDSIVGTGGTYRDYRSTVRIYQHADFSGFSLVNSGGDRNEDNRLHFSGTTGTIIFKPRPLPSFFPNIYQYNGCSLVVEGSGFACQRLVIENGTWDFGSVGAHRDSVLREIAVIGATSSIKFGADTIRAATLAITEGSLDAGNAYVHLGLCDLDWSKLSELKAGSATFYLPVTGGGNSRITPKPGSRMPHFICEFRSDSYIYVQGAGEFGTVELRNGIWKWNTAGSAHTIDAFKITNGKMEFGNDTVKVFGDADFSGATNVSGNVPSVLSMSKSSGTQVLTSRPGQSWKLPRIVKDSSGTLQLATKVECASFEHARGTLDFNGKSLLTVGDLRVVNGTTSSIAGLGGDTVFVGGRGFLGGQAGNLLNLNPAAKWYVKASGDFVAQYAVVGNSDASPGKVGKALVSSNGAGNVNWVFFRSWTGGGADELWSTAANWSPAGVPDVGESVAFGAVNKSCRLSQSVSAGMLEFQSGFTGTLYLSGKTLACSTFSTVSGGLQCGSDSLIIVGDADFSGLTQFDADSGTVVIKAYNSNVNFMHGGHSYNKLVLWSNPVTISAEIVPGPGAFSVRKDLLLVRQMAKSGANAKWVFSKNNPSIVIGGSLSTETSGSSGGNSAWAYLGKGTYTVGGDFRPSFGTTDSAVIVLNGSGTQQVTASGTRVYHRIEHTGTSTALLGLTTDAVFNVRHFIQTAGKADIRGAALSTTTMTVSGTGEPFVNLDGKTLSASDSIVFTGSSLALLNLNPAGPWNISAVRKLTATDAIIGKSNASGGVMGIATNSSDAGGNANWSFNGVIPVLDTFPPNNRAVLTSNAKTVTEAVINWSKPESDSADADSVFVYQASSLIGLTGPFRVLIGNLGVADTAARSITVTGLTSGSRYFIGLWIRDKSGNLSAPSYDSITMPLPGQIVNPLVVRGTYIDSAHVALRISGYESINTVFDLIKPYADTAGVWFQAGSFVPKPSAAHNTIVKMSIVSIKAKGNVFDTTITVAPLSPSGSRYYYFNASLFWHREGRDTLSDFQNVNGDSVLMADTTKPRNPLAISGHYIDTDSAALKIDSIASADVTKLDSVFVWYGFGQTPDFLDPITKRFSLESLVARSIGGATLDTIRNAQFIGELDTVYCALIVRGRNGRTSDTTRSTFTVGQLRPVNPIELGVQAISAGKIVLSWNSIAGTGYDSLRIFFAHEPIPLTHLVPAGYEALYSDPAATVDTLDGLLPGLEYFFGAQVRKDGLWSPVTEQASANATTLPGDTTPVTQTIQIDDKWFDSLKNELVVVWKINSYDPSKDTLLLAMTSSLDPTSIPVPARGTQVRVDHDTSRIALGAAILFDTTYYAAIWIKRENSDWVLPTKEARAEIKTGSFRWQPVTFFSGSDSLLPVFNGSVILRKPANWKGAFPDTIDFYQPLATNGMILLNSGISFRSHYLATTPRFFIGMRADVLPPGFSLDDVRIYRDSLGMWLNDETVQVDSSSKFIWINTQNLTLPIVLMIDTVRPAVVFTSDTSSAVASNTAIATAYRIIDNVANVRLSYVYGKGGDAPILGGGKVLSDTSSADSMAVAGSFVTDDNGVRILLVISDGRFNDTINASRRVIRMNSDPTATDELNWVPLRTTADLKAPDAPTCLSALSADSSSWRYDTRHMRVFRWEALPQNVADTNKWIEYSETQKDLFSFSPGKLFWVKTLNPARFDFGEGTTVSLKDTFALKAAPGTWTDFALPWKFDVRLGDIIRSTRHDTTLLAFFKWGEVEKSYVTDPLYVPFMPEIQNSDTALASGNRDGYSVYNSGTDTIALRIPPVPLPMSPSSRSGHPKRKSGEWVLRISPVHDSKERASAVYLGYNPEARKVRWYPPSPSFSNSGIRIIDRSSGKRYGHVVVPELQNGGARWDLVFCNESRGPSSFTFRISTVGWVGAHENLSAVLLNPTTGEEQSIELSGSSDLIVVKTGGLEEHRVLAVGNVEYLRRTVTDAWIFKTALIAAWPNPFNRFVRISYSLADANIRELRFSLVDARGRTVWKFARQSGFIRGIGSVAWSSGSEMQRAPAAGFYMLTMTVVDMHGKQSVLRNRMVCIP